MSLGECITVAIVACQAPSKVVGQVKVGTQCCLPLADKSVGCSLRAQKVSRSMQTAEAVDQSSSTSGRHHDFPPTVKHEELQQGQLYHCDCCNYATARLSALIVHECRCTASGPSISPSTAEGDQGCLCSRHLCEHQTKYLHDLEMHTRIHTCEGSFKCHLSPQSFSQRSIVKGHLRTHTCKKPFQCSSCPQSFSRKTTLNTHLRIHTGERPFKCHFCPQSFSQRSTLKAHLRTHTCEKPFQCPSCPQSFSQKANLNTHLRIHTGERPFKCQLCPQSFSQRSTLTAHLRTHTGEKPFQCSSCPQSFSQKTSLNLHLQIHTGEKPFSCPSCPKKFRNSVDFNRHLRIHTGTCASTQAPVHPHR
ncbi:zinc finger protein 239-like isoform X2 [Dermacentor silvarum]|uniref:zinc finger protein 239-like isoform X2 n=1 Tax=Dermacentor silvarum TaxID=543639 RepID=UPI002101427C|nr:zinc finger protein 239-like isoform X2 [Dermacentor silvarum]